MIYQRITPPRLTIDITETQSKGLSRHLEHGMRKILFGLIVDDLLRLFDEFGASMVIGAMVERAISLKEICKLDLEG